MGGTFRRARKTFGVKKTRNHFSRSSWSRKNEGIRLRSLLADIEDFKEVAGDDAFGAGAGAALAGTSTLHGSGIPAPKPIAIPSIPRSRKKETSKEPAISVEEVVETVVLSHHHKRPIKPVTAVTKNIKKTSPNTRTAFLEGLSDKDLEARKEYASRQSSYLTTLANSLTHASYASAVLMLRSRKRYWDSLAGSVGRILWDRKNAK